MSEFTSNVQVSTDSKFLSLLVNETLTNKNYRDFLKNELPYGTRIYARVRHNNPETGMSNWSDSVCFQMTVPANIIGVCLDNSGTAGVFYWIDALGNRIASFDWTKHPIYTNISMATVDTDRAPVTLTKIPLFYVKTAASGPVGSFADGKKCWWISDFKDAGFHPAACFKRNTALESDGKYAIAAYCYMSTFLGHSESVGGVTCLGSKRGQVVLASQTKEAFRTLITNRNNAAAGISGFRMFDIWDLGALRLLLLIAKSSADTQLTWGDNSAGTTYPKTGSTNARAVFKGTNSDPQVSIEDLWRCYWYHADLISVASGVVSLTSPMDLSSTLSFGSIPASRYTQPTATGWIRDILDCPMTIGNDVHDLMELFLPKTVVSSESQGSFSDQHSNQGNPVQTVAGRAGNGSTENGIFRVAHSNPYDATIGVRLSKN